jgi:hypothetical protein
MSTNPPSDAVQPERAKERAASYLSPLPFARLNHACSVVTEAFGNPPYLVGSALERHDWRDVDVRSILDDAEWDALFADREFLWGLFCLGVSSYLSQMTGLPIDYQAQRMTEANERFGGRMRNALGMKARLYAGGGDATPAR